jgi:rRNA maturation endonuclease Nob1
MPTRKTPTLTPRPEPGPAVRCKACGNQYRNGKRCPYCGTPIPSQPKEA